MSVFRRCERQKNKLSLLVKKKCKISLLLLSSMSAFLRSRKKNESSLLVNKKSEVSLLFSRSLSLPLCVSPSFSVCLLVTHTQTPANASLPLCRSIWISLFFLSLFFLFISFYCCSVRTAPLNKCPHTDICVAKKKGGPRRREAYAD